MRLARLHYDNDSAVADIAGESLHVLLELPDHLGSTSLVIDRNSGELVEAGTYTASGAAETDHRTPRWKHFREDYRFTGKEDDIEVGLTYFGKRYLVPALGTWLNPDPLAVHSPGSADLNLYAYVHGQLLAAVDPVGLDANKTPAPAAGATPAPPPVPGSPAAAAEEIQAGPKTMRAAAAYLAGGYFGKQVYATGVPWVPSPADVASHVSGGSASPEDVAWFNIGAGTAMQVLGASDQARMLAEAGRVGFSEGTYPGSPLTSVGTMQVAAIEANRVRAGAMIVFGAGLVAHGGTILQASAAGGGTGGGGTGGGGKPAPAPAPPPPAAPPPAAAPAAPPTILHTPNVTIVTKGRPTIKGMQDVGPTIDRIAAGVKHPHVRDGTTWGNWKNQLPRKRYGYYTEYVHPTQGVSHAGVQRIVTGSKGEVYYTPDHYGTFHRIKLCARMGLLASSFCVQRQATRTFRSMRPCAAKGLCLNFLTALWSFRTLDTTGTRYLIASAT